MRIAVALVSSVLVAACSSCGAPASTVVTDITAGLNFTICVLGQIATCEAATPVTPWPACSVQTIAACGGTALQVGQVLDARNAGLVKSGYVPKLSR